MVFPTRVGMNRFNPFKKLGSFRVPHTRGDEPDDQIEAARQILCSPHAWG